MADPDYRIEALEGQVASLQRTVTTLVEVLLRTGTLSESDRRAVDRAALRPREDFASAREEVEREEEAPRAIVASPYRGGAPIDASGCGVCGKRIDPDDPELSLASRGRVCTMCFTRGG